MVLSGAETMAHSGSCASNRPSALETDARHEEAARALVAKAEDGCLVTVSLALPVQTTVQIRTSVLAR